MLAGFEEILQAWQSSALLLFVIFLRIGAAMALMPGFGEQAVPVRVRLILAIAFTLIVWPMVLESQGSLQNGFRPLFFMTEAIAGLAIGVFFRLFVMVLQLAGMMAAQATSLSQIFGGGATPDPLPAFGNLLVIGGLALAMMSGLHVKFALALSQTYDAIPMGTLPDPSDLTQWGVTGISKAFALSFSLAAPFVIASVIYNVAIGAINRAMPQLMVAFVGAPAITLGSMILLAITAPTMLAVWLRSFDAGLADPFGYVW
jgi:flagellar biosynthesis protein FliR